jgi:hypothetical protein
MQRTAHHHVARASRIHAASALAVAHLEQLEPRRLFAAQINFDSGFTSTTGLSLNGETTLTGTALQLTDNNDHESGSVFSTTKVPIEKFTSHFEFNFSAGASTADGITFTVQNDAANAVGGNGNGLGFQSITSSAGIAINIFNNGSFGETMGLATAGEQASLATNTDLSSELDLHNGDSINATVVYNGTDMNVTLTDATDSSKTITESYPVNLTSVVGANTAFVGFTGSTGANASTQQILSWDYTGTNTPTISQAAAATPNPVIKTKTALTVIATDADADLTYTWAVASKPAGAEHAPTFSDNGTNSAKNTIAKFFKAGRYGFRVTASNGNGQSVTSYISVLVNATPSRMGLDPHKQILHNGDTQQYAGKVFDQFGNPLNVQPTITYSIVEGGGTISSTGLYTSNGVGHVVVQAADGAILGTVGATVLA